MSPSLKSLDSKTKCIRLVQSCIVISLRRCGSDKFIKSDNDILVNDLVNVRSHSWPDNASGRPISPATLSYNSNDANIISNYNPLSSTSSYAQRCCTCNQIDGWTLFNQFINENSTSVWNPYIVGCLGQLQFKGFLCPVNLLIGGTEFALEVMRSAWARRVLKAPQGFEIEFIGDISFIESSVVNQTQFTPLAEALCKSIAELNIRQISASFDAIVKRLELDFPNMELPSEKVLRNSLKTLCQERKLYYFKEKDCYIASFYSYKNDYLMEDMKTTFSPNNQHMMTSEDAFTRLHGKTNLVCDESSTSYRSSDGKHNAANITNNSHSKNDSFGSQPNPSTMTLKTENNLDNNSVTQISSSLRRSASLRIEAHKTNNADENKAFNRSKSFKMNREKMQLFNDQQTDLKERCTCKTEPNKKQSMLSKFLRMGNVNSSSKTKAYASKNANFSSQFPEINGKLIADSDITKNIAAVETKSKATQTIKCGAEDGNIAALIVKQAKKHAFAKNNRQQNNNNDYDCKNKSTLVCCCVQDYLNSELTDGKSVLYGARISKRANECRIGTNGNELPFTPQEDCLLCNTETNNKVNLNGHENVHNNNNYNKDRAVYKQLRNNSNGSYKFHNAIKDNKQISFYNDNDNSVTSVTSPLYIQTHAHSDQFKHIDNNANNGISIQTERMPEQQEIVFLNNNNNHNHNHNNNSSNSVVGPKDKPQQHMINATVNTKYLKDCQLRFTQNHSSTPLEEKHVGLSDNANNLTLDNSFNVKIEIGSSPATNNIIANINGKHDKRVVRQNSSDKNISFINSNPVITSHTHDNQANHIESSHKKNQIVTSATTVTTTMTIPNIYSNDSHYQIRTNGQQLNESNDDNNLVVKCVKLCKEDNTSKMSNNKQNNLYNDYRNNSIPHLSPIRQKVAKAKAEFFNSSQPQSPKTLVSNHNILIKKI